MKNKREEEIRSCRTLGLSEYYNWIAKKDHNYDLLNTGYMYWCTEVLKKFSLHMRTRSTTRGIS